MGSELAQRDQQAVTAAEAEAQALAAVEAVEHVDTPEDAEALLRKITAYQQAVRLAKIGHEQERRWASIRLQAERKMGELLGPAEHGGDRRSESSSSLELEQAEKHARTFARKVAAIPEDAFTAYLETAEEPTRAGLLRKAAAPRPAPEPIDVGPQKAKQQGRLVAGIAEKARHIADLESHLDLEAIRALPEEERDQWKQQLSAARTVLSRLIGAL